MSILERIGCKILDIVIFLLKVAPIIITTLIAGSPIALFLAFIIGVSAQSFKVAVITFIITNIAAAIGLIRKMNKEE